MKTILLSMSFAVSVFATTVSSITCSSQTATVNSTAHGLVASQGFELTGTSAQFNGTAVTVTANAFTFTVPTGTACSIYTSGYTTVAPAQQIITLPATPNPPQGTVTMNYYYWFTTVYPNPLSCNLGTSGTQCPVSQWPSANAAQNAALVAGTTVELPGHFTVPANTIASAVQTQAATQYAAMQVGFAGYLLAPSACFNGITWILASGGTCQ